MTRLTTILVSMLIACVIGAQASKYLKEEDVVRGLVLSAQCPPGWVALAGNLKEKKMNIIKKITTVFNEEETLLLLRLLGKMSTADYLGREFSKGEAKIFDDMHDRFINALERDEDDVGME